MAEKDTTKTIEESTGGQSATAVKEKPQPAKAPKKKPPSLLPMWKVLLHNDDKNTRDHVVKSLVQLTPLNEQEAVVRMDEADRTGVALLLTTHKERAELYKEQLESKSLTVTIEPAV